MSDKEQFEPRIAAFFCNWCTYGGADLAGVSRLQYPPNIRVVRIPCTGRMSPKFILQAFRQGADGIWVSGCHPGDCHYIAGNMYARRRFAVLKNLLEYVGLEPGRIHFSWISSAEATKFQETVIEVTNAVRALGPAKFMLKDIAPQAQREVA
ncbi:methyl-viologen-reducing hydrogenase delta subunit [Desulfarculus baarsii DSM 2075]|uniref:Methyl-viologen-reducing hydrogenase delta subunit n=1 Tax=Desulfarculus baarsii (strain ATCC 33931 / DSM 2075 / LMG 7858 / VKM B-1802 / 2st14) TaxID=644282 RepID=E1QII1_DESB2|nr:hydrogenase iron-sulfur subunit [Desulfarculus baarsii]ADK85498.1 methyl-viologen-reducing hydrogenase delta subunit [Desulfarculus baarsii DSM 2075]